MSGAVHLVLPDLADLYTSAQLGVTILGRRYAVCREYIDDRSPVLCTACLECQAIPDTEIASLWRSA